MNINCRNNDNNNVFEGLKICIIKAWNNNNLECVAVVNGVKMNQLGRGTKLSWKSELILDMYFSGE